ncbi:amino acid adenylation domain-containing protein [Campylobacter curvus]|uniref:amino acid adenylation domain-containing protein n=1 Tax=Campylobacter curvus TaxID=200 RepID=UPI001470648C|nr:amino acid adenylation domain-containing protein [Campylobacter curvus]
MQTIYSVFRDVVAAHGDERAIIEDGGTLTFAQLSRMVDAIAAHFPPNLNSAGIVMSHGTQMIAAIFAVLKCGARYVPAEPDFPTGRIATMMSEANVDFIVTQREFAPRLEGFELKFIDEICKIEGTDGLQNDKFYESRTGWIAHEICDLKNESKPKSSINLALAAQEHETNEASMSAESFVRQSASPQAKTEQIHDLTAENQIELINLANQTHEFTDRSDQIYEPENPSSDAPAYVLYTSGTTGRPKGVCVTNRNVCHYVRAFASEFHPRAGDVMLQQSVCSFDIFVEEVFASLLNGAALAIASQSDKEDIGALMRFVARHNVTMLSGFPYLLAQMNELPCIPRSLRLLISGGDVLRGAYVSRLLAQAEIYNTYGPSETTVCASYYRCNGGAVLKDDTYPIGRAVKGARIKILNEHGEELGVGEKGEICIYGGGVSEGYIGEHDAENRAFESLPDGGRMYRSGDLGYLLPSGDIAFLHRKDTQVMIRGKRTEVAEVEARLRRCAGVSQAIVRAFTDEAGLAYMVAYVVGEGENLSLRALKSELARNLTEFMIPEFFIRLPQMPLNTSGKPDAAKLPIPMKDGRK